MDGRFFNFKTTSILELLENRSTMKKLLRSLFRISLFALLLLIGVVMINTITYTSRQVEIQPVKTVTIDSIAIAERLSKAIQYPTISLPNRIDTTAFIGLDTFLRTSFPLIDSLLEFKSINRFSRVYKWPGNNARLPPILLTGHLDVVPVDEGATKDWLSPPFSGTVSNGFIVGRGTLDDKSAVLGIFESIEQLLKEGYTPERTVYLAFGHDEEIRGKHGAQQIAAYFEKESITFEYAMDEGMVIMKDAVKGLDQSVAIIGIAEKGYVTLTLTAQLEDAGHSSLPPSETAIGLLSEAITKLESQPFPASTEGVLSTFFDYVGPEMSPLYKSVLANRWLTEKILLAELSKAEGTNASIRTTMAPTMIRGGFKENILPTRASAKLNFRIKPGESIATVVDQVKKIISDERIIVALSTESEASEPSSIASVSSFGFEVIQRSVQEVFTDVVVAPGLVVGATDGKYYESVSENVYRFLPVHLSNSDLKRIHGRNEQISVEAYQQMVQFYYQLLKNSCQ
jgi:carboxypeptidase PM20D1